MFTFLRLFRRFLESRDIPCDVEPDGSQDVLFLNSFATPVEEVRGLIARLPSALVVHRIDGSTRDYGNYEVGDERQREINALADLTIFQSEYSRYSTVLKYPIIGNDGPIVYNATDCGLFKPAASPPAMGPVRVCVTSFSTNPRKGTGDIGALAADNSDVEFVLCGRFPNRTDLPNVRYMGLVPNHELPGVLGGCHVYMHLAENDPCPNVVIEALSTGLPVLYRDSGGTPELVGDCGCAVTAKTFRTQLDKVVSSLEEMRAMARARALSHFDYEKNFQAYLDHIGEALQGGKR
jgi:glycosyltransferase involved in cell wall biosynthesis